MLLQNGADVNYQGSKFTKAAHLLIKYGAKPLKDKVGRTPLMTLTRNDFGVSYCRRLRFHFHEFEANHYGIPTDSYLKGLEELNHSGLH